MSQGNRVTKKTSWSEARQHLVWEIKRRNGRSYRGLLPTLSPATPSPTRNLAELSLLDKGCVCSCNYHGFWKKSNAFLKCIMSVRAVGSLLWLQLWWVSRGHRSKQKREGCKGAFALERYNSTSNAFIESVIGCFPRTLGKWCLKMNV